MGVHWQAYAPVLSTGCVLTPQYSDPSRRGALAGEPLSCGPRSPQAAAGGCVPGAVRRWLSHVGDTAVSHPEPSDVKARWISHPQPISSDGCQPLAWPGSIREEEGESLLEAYLLFQWLQQFLFRVMVVSKVHLPSGTQPCTPSRALQVPPNQSTPALWLPGPSPWVSRVWASDLGQWQPCGPGASPWDPHTHTLVPFCTF